ncbi:MAG: HRDC domain-containing protein [Actinomycetes bacterium]
MAELLLTPRNGLSALIESDEALRAAIDELASGTGPIAVDAERASGYRYSQRAYLIQIYRRGGGLHLIDPIAANNPETWALMDRTFKECEWIIHASTQDLPCLRELGIAPKSLFDTELGGRIAGCERVGLGALSEELLGIQLAKEHSAVDWSLRPLKEEWLTYAALDVDVLIDLRDAMEELLRSRGYLEYAQEDFAAILQAPPSPSKRDPWRKTSGMHKVRDRMTLAIIRDLYAARDAYARKVDIAPGRIFNDDALVEIATKRPLTIDLFSKIISRRSRIKDQPFAEWFDIYRTTQQLPKEELPELRTPTTGLPPQKLWKDRNPPGYARLTHARAAVIERAEELGIPAENLISPEAVRQAMWHNPESGDGRSYIEEKLRAAGARSWQIENVAEFLVAPLHETEPLPAPVAPEAEPASEPAGDGTQLPE